jgi:hypothetical protein
MLRTYVDARGGLVEIEESSPARGTGDELRPRGAKPRAQENGLRNGDRVARVVEAAERLRVADAVAQERVERSPRRAAPAASQATRTPSHSTSACVASARRLEERRNSCVSKGSPRREQS